MKNQFENLFTPYKIGKLTVKNRYAVAPMGIAPWVDGSEFTKEGINYLVERAKGGFGLIVYGAMCSDMDIDKFSKDVLITPLYNPGSFVKSSAILNERVHAYGTKIFAQVSMGFGRNYPGFYAPSETSIFLDPAHKSKSLTKDQIKRKIDLMIQSAAIVKKAGFDGFELHGMHWGYLLDNFAMSITNQRDDEYGGTLENRMRCAKEIIQGVKQVCGNDFPVSMRLGLKSYMKGLGRTGQMSLDGIEEAGRTLEEGIEICKMLEEYGCDVLDCDLGVYESLPIGCLCSYLPKGMVMDITKEAKKAVNIPILACGRMDDPYMAEQGISDGKMDAVILGRASLADPYLPKKVQMGKVDAIRPCLACNQGCLGKANVDGGASCAVNPQACRELTYGIVPAKKIKKVVVVGGGVSGMEAARVAKISGHDVTLYEASDHLGGNLIPAGAHSFKEDVRRLNAWYERELNELNIPVHLNSKMEADKIIELHPDVAILSVGSVPVIPPVPGLDNPKVATCIEILEHRKKAGENTIVIGGGLVGCEIALDLAMKGKKVTIIEMQDDILSCGPKVPMMNDMAIRAFLDEYKVTLRKGCRMEAVNDEGVIIKAKDADAPETIAADTIILSVGFKSVPSMAQDLYGNGIDIYETGDGNRVGNIMTSIWDAYEIARDL